MRKRHKLIEYFVAEANAKHAAYLTGVNRKTGVYCLHRLHEIICLNLVQEPNAFFDVEIDDLILEVAEKESVVMRYMRQFNDVPDHFYLFLKECEWRFNTKPQTQLAVKTIG